MRVLYCDLGTYCDFSISKQIILRLLEKKNHVCYITSTDNHVLKEENQLLQKYTYPSIPILDMVDFAETTNIISNLVNPLTIINTISLLSKQVKIFRHIVEIIKKEQDNVDVIVLTYPLLCVLKQIQKFVPEHVPLVLFYVAPAYPNLYIPWIFDNQLREPDFSLYSYKNKKEHINSHYQYNWIISLCGAIWNNIFTRSFDDYVYKKKTLMERTRNLYLISAWNKDLIPPITSPISVAKSHWFHVNGIFDYPSGSLPIVIQDFLKTPGLVVYIALGSMKLENMNDFVKVVYKAIQKQTMKMKLLVQDNQNQLRIRSKKDMLIFHGSIPYASILSKTNLLMTTGSYCIQHLALSLHIPMLFVPTLTEQYFWAKNYQYHTDIPYIENVQSITYTKQEIEKVSNMISFILEQNQKPHKLSSWLDQQYINAHGQNGAKQFVSVIKNIMTLH